MNQLESINRMFRALLCAAALSCVAGSWYWVGGALLFAMSAPLSWDAGPDQAAGVSLPPPGRLQVVRPGRRSLRFRPFAKGDFTCRQC